MYVFCTISFILSAFSIASACKGCLVIDQYNFDKIVPRFDVVVVKFDENFPHGERQDIFTAFANSLVDNEHIIVAQAPIRDYGILHNEEFGKEHGILTNNDLPSLQLFVKGKDEPFVFNKNLTWNGENLNQFIRNNTSVYWSEPGCLETFDDLVLKFTYYSNDRAAILRETEEKANRLSNRRQKKIANNYIQFMKKITEEGFRFAFDEQVRLENEQEELAHRLNIIKVFTRVQGKRQL